MASQLKQYAADHRYLLGLALRLLGVTADGHRVVPADHLAEVAGSGQLMMQTSINDEKRVAA